MEEDIRLKLNRETAKIDWQSLAPFFATGQMLHLAKGNDLIEAAAAIAEDDAKKVKALQAANALSNASDQQAQQWHEQNATLWAVVIKPWVLVQEV